MADFAANLTRTFTDSNGVERTIDDLTLSTDGTTITAVDTSNYTTSTEDGAQAADFTTYRKLIVTDDNQSVFTFSSIGDGDEDCEPGDSGENDFVFTPQAGDSLYTFQLITIPTWDAAAAYTTGDVVVKTVSSEVIIYSALQAGTNKDPVTQTAYWEVIEEEDVSGKYNVTGHLAVARTIEVAQIEAIQEAEQLFNTEDFASPLGNLWWVKAATLDMDVKSISINVQQGNWEKVSQLIAEGKITAAEDCSA